MVKQIWWKVLAIVLLLYTCTVGFLVKVPVLDGRLQHSIRNTFFHVPMWFGMMALLTTSVVYAIKYLQKPKSLYDAISVEFARTGALFAILGLITGAIWANYQWGSPWNGDPKQNGAAIALLIYLAYFVLRGSVTDVDKRARLGAIYNIFAFAMLFPTLWILPRMTESLHPGGLGSQGNPGLNPNDSSIGIKLVMWPAFFGWTLLGVWVTSLRIRLSKLSEKKLSNG